MKTGIVIVLIVVGAVFLFAARFSAVRNHLSSSRQAIDSDWAQVNTELDRRAEILPRLAQEVRAYPVNPAAVAAVEKSSGDLMRTTAPEDKIRANDQVDIALGNLLLALEKTPALKASKTFQNLEYQLEDSENKILEARQTYNKALQDYNTELRVFPENVVARLCGFDRDEAYFRTDVGARIASGQNSSKF